MESVTDTPGDLVGLITNPEELIRELKNLPKNPSRGELEEIRYSLTVELRRGLSPLSDPRPCKEQGLERLLVRTETSECGDLKYIHYFESKDSTVYKKCGTPTVKLTCNGFRYAWIGNGYHRYRGCFVLYKGLNLYSLVSGSVWSDLERDGLDGIWTTVLD